MPSYGLEVIEGQTLSHMETIVLSDDEEIIHVKFWPGMDLSTPQV